MELRTSTHDLEESGVSLTLNITETVGFGDQLNRVRCAMQNIYPGRS